MEELNKICPHCGAENEVSHAACLKCGHLLGGKPIIKEEVEAFDVTIEPVDYTKSIGKPAVTKNGGLLVQSIIAFLVTLAMIGGIYYVNFFLLKEKVALAYDETGAFIGQFDMWVYIFLGIELVGAFLFFIPKAIANNAFAKRYNRTKNAALGWSNFFAVFTRIICILAILAGLALVVYNIVVLWNDLWSMIQALISGGGVPNGGTGA